MISQRIFLYMEINMIIAKLFNLKYSVFISIKGNTNLLLLPVRGRNILSERFKRSNMINWIPASDYPFDIFKPFLFMSFQS